jgi:hypothetical protein
MTRPNRVVHNSVPKPAVDDQPPGSALSLRLSWKSDSDFSTAIGGIVAIEGAMRQFAMFSR